MLIDNTDGRITQRQMLQLLHRTLGEQLKASAQMTSVYIQRCSAWNLSYDSRSGKPRQWKLHKRKCKYTYTRAVRNATRPAERTCDANTILRMARVPMRALKTAGHAADVRSCKLLFTSASSNLARASLSFVLVGVLLVFVLVAASLTGLNSAPVCDEACSFSTNDSVVHTPVGLCT